MINVTKSYLPDYKKYETYLKQIWNNSWLTNNGPLVQQLEKRLLQKLDVSHLQFVSNGTIAIQLAIKALELKGEIITTPYSYVATTTSILWENCAPVFCDIEERNFGLDTNKIESLITNKTSAILATHVYGYPCNVEELEAIAIKHNLKIIYDAAHAFGCNFKGKSLLNYGNISTLSFHATKVFHTIEGGGIVVKDDELNEKIFLLKSFGHRGDNYILPGINGKNSEFHAAMGLCVLEDFELIMNRRKEICHWYDVLLDQNEVFVPRIPEDLEYNYAYYPVLFRNEKVLLNVINELNKSNIIPRRYFYPSLNKLPYLSGRVDCPVSENLSSRVICLPLFFDLKRTEVEMICSIINKSFSE